MSEGDRDMESVLKPEQKKLKAELLKAFQAYDINGGQVSRRPLPARLLRTSHRSSHHSSRHHRTASSTRRR